MKQFDDQNYVNNLPDCYEKSKTSNNYKILSIEKYSIDGVNKDISDIFDSLNLNNATGKTLDLYGEMLNQPRGVATDDQYILLIRSKIMRNLSSGDYRGVVNAICHTFECDASEVLIIEKDEPCVVELVVLPLKVIVKAGLTTKQTVAMVKQLLPIGITLESFLFEGTFAFADNETSQDNKAGFCDVEDGIIGGYFGILYGEDDEPILPI